MAIGHPSGTMTELYKQAQSRIPATIPLPSQWLKSYEEFVTKNASAVSQIESALRSLTYIIPGRFRESELASETLHTSTLLLSLYHTSILRRQFPSPFPPSLQTRYTTFHNARSRLYSNSAVLLQTIQYTELLCEMFFKRRGGDKARWRLVVVLEIIKAVCRTIMFWITGRKMVIEGVGAERPNVPEASSSSSSSPNLEEIQQEDGITRDNDSATMSIKEARTTEWSMPRTGMKLPVLPTQDRESVTDFLSKRVISADDIKAAHLLLRKISSIQGQAAEMMWILRPVVYALAMQRLQGRNRKDWRPWILGLGMEVAARELGKKEFRERMAGGWRGMTGLEKEEMKRRGWGLAWWGMRGAFYENVTK
ncbi:MAG: hypothetical protein L6R41_001085 [Letrouitia leprolyta]|nr:MAG: hypothetical protein L6R41_001085 [Letrouitia leprolyta]